MPIWTQLNSKQIHQTFDQFVTKPTNVSLQAFVVVSLKAEGKVFHKGHVYVSVYITAAVDCVFYFIF